MWGRISELINSLIDALGMTQFDLVSIIFSLLLAIILAVIISQIYKFTHRGLNYELTFMSTLVLLSPIITIVMLFIRGDLVLSLGLIGSISIIRFRTPIKDTRDMVFLFWSITTGLGCGTFNWDIAVISTIVIGLTIVALYFLRYGQSEATDYVLVVNGAFPNRPNKVLQVIHEHTSEARMRSQEIEGDYWETIFEIQFDSQQDVNVTALIQEIKSIESVQKVSLLAPQIALPV